MADTTNPPSSPSPPKSWSIYTRSEIVAKYQVMDRIGSGAYSDVYKGRRLSDGLIVALKEVHDYRSALREIDALHVLRGSPNVVVLHEYFWRQDEDAVLVLEFLKTDLFSVIHNAKKEGESLPVGDIKQWMIQILCGLDACHSNFVMHRDLKPANLLISDDGVLKLADFGQARILMESRYHAMDENPPPPYEDDVVNDERSLQHSEEFPQKERQNQEGYGNPEQGSVTHDEYFRALEEMKTKSCTDDMEKDVYFQDGNTSCLATCTISDVDDDFMKGSFTYEADDRDNEQGGLTSCVGTRWYRSPELLYGSIDYGLEIDLWSLGCIFAELLNLEPLFPGSGDIDQLSRIIDVLGNLNEEVWPGCSKLPDYDKISFTKVESPPGVEDRLPNRSPDEVSLVKKLVCYDPARRATAMELLKDNYFTEEPLPVPISELRVPLEKITHDEDSHDIDDFNLSDYEDFDPVNVIRTGTGFSIQFP